MNKMNRREFFARGGAALSLGAVIAACAGNEAIGPGRIGSGDTGATLPTVEVDDSVLLRTAESLHLTAIDVHQRILDSGAASSDVAAVLTTLIERHQTQAEVLGAASGSAFGCSNPFVSNRYVEPTFAAFETSDDPGRDATNIAIAFEEWVARSHQDMLTSLESPEDRAVMLEIATQVARQSVALEISAGQPEFNPVLMGQDAVDKDENGFPIYYVIPSLFGQLTAVPLTVGEVNADGQRFSVNLQTPAANTYVLSSTPCDASS